MRTDAIVNASIMSTIHINHIGRISTISAIAY